MTRLLREGQVGATLVELLVAVPIIAMIVGGVAGMLFEMVNAHNYVSDSVQCYREVQRAGAWFSRDAVQAQVLQDNNYENDATTAIAVDQDLTIPGTEVFIVEWTDWNDDRRRVVYSIVPVQGSSLFELHRTVEVNDLTTDSHTAAEHVDTSVDPENMLDVTRFEWSTDEKQTVRMIVTTTYGQESVTRLYEVRPRAMVPA